MTKSKIVTIPEISGTHKEVSVSLVNASFQTSDGSRFKYVDDNFGYWLIMELHEEKRIFSKTKGRFRRRHFCPFCAVELFADWLEAHPPIIEPRELELKYNEFPSFFVRISLPWTYCPTCTKIFCFDKDGYHAGSLMDAIVKAFQSNNIRR